MKRGHASPQESNYSFHSVTSDPTPASFTVPIETFTREETINDEQVYSDAPPSSPGHPETPSPTVSSFAFCTDAAKANSVHRPSSRRLSERTRSSLVASVTRLKNASKASVVLPSKASRALSHLTRTRKASKASQTPSEAAIQDTDAYAKDPDPFRTSSAPQESEPIWGESSAATPENAADFTWGGYTTTSPEGPAEAAWDDIPTAHSSRSSSPAPTRRSSLKNTFTKFSHSLHSLRQSSRVSFKHLTPISSSGHTSFVRSSQPQESVSPGVVSPSFASRPPSEADTLFPGSPDFPAPRPRTSSRLSKAPSVHIPLASLPGDTAAGVVSPLELTASPSAAPSVFDSPAQTTLPPPSRPNSWWFSPSEVFSPPPPPTSDPPSAHLPDQQLELPTPKPRASVGTFQSKASRSIPWKASTSQFADSLPSHQPSAPSAVPSHWSEQLASSAPPTPTQSAARSRAPSVGRSSESILFPESGAFGEHQRVSQTSLPVRVPSINPSHIVLPPSTFTTPSPSVRAYSRRNSTVKVITILESMSHHRADSL